jgi:phosphatidylglycerophosphatase A
MEHTNVGIDESIGYFFIAGNALVMMTGAFFI